MEQGYYWVKYNGEWTVAKCTGTNWYVPGVLGSLDYSSFEAFEQNALEHKAGFVKVDSKNPADYG